MKKILLNGCSFVAGDALTWDTHFPDINWMKHVFYKKLHPTYSSKQICEISLDYKFNLRPKDNLRGQLEKLLKVDVIDISTDGNSNDNIAMSTIGFLTSLSPNERKQYHICIGWTELTRRIKWVEEHNHFFNLHHSHLNDIQYKGYAGFIKESIINPHDLDHVYNFFKNIFMLQCYLKLNGISFTFWKSLGDPGQPNDITEIDSVFSRNRKNGCIPFEQETCFDANDWLTLNNDASDWITCNNNRCPWLEKSWGYYITSRKHFVSDDNRHPSLQAVIDFSLTVADRIKNDVL
jgi:hypothetical protein